LIASGCSARSRRPAPSCWPSAARRRDADAPRAGAILGDDHYGWFERVERGVYALTPAGRQGLAQHGIAAPDRAA